VYNTCNIFCPIIITCQKQKIMLNQNLFRKVSNVALSGAMLASSLLPFTAVTVVAATPKVEITNTNDKAIVDRGDVVTYTIVVKNTGDTATNNTYLWINFPNLATYVAGSGTAVKMPANVTKNLVDAWVNDGVNFGTLQPNEFVTLTYKTKVADNANANDIIWSVATVKSDQTSQVTASSYSRMVFKEAALCADKTADKKVVEKGDVVTFSIHVCNKSNINLTDILIRDEIPVPLNYVAGSTTLDIDGKTIKIADSWQDKSNPNFAWVNIGNLPPGYDATLKFKVTVGQNLTDGQVIENVAQINAKEIEKAFRCAYILTGKVLGITKPPTELPDTGPGEVILALASLVPAGLLLKRFKSKI
jgi:uncharacterized repeat protein (TIGR01451 family)